MYQLKKDIEIGIIIVHIINPHQFYFKLENSPFSDELQLEKDLQKYSEDKMYHLQGHKHNVNDTVSVFVPTWKKWVRAKVEQIFEYDNEETKYVLWTIDKG